MRVRETNLPIYVSSRFSGRRKGVGVGIFACVSKSGLADVIAGTLGRQRSSLLGRMVNKPGGKREPVLKPLFEFPPFNGTSGKLLFSACLYCLGISSTFLCIRVTSGYRFEKFSRY